MIKYATIGGSEYEVEINGHHLVWGTDRTLMARPMVRMDGDQIQADVFRDEEGRWIVSPSITGDADEFIIHAVYEFARRAGKA